MKKLIFALALLASLIFAAPAFAYTVEKGDTMSNIARENDLTLQELAKANPQINNLDLIYVGQHIYTNKVNNSPLPSREATSKKTRSNKLSISDDEIDLLARLVRAEAQTESFEGKAAVASVVLNRVESPQFPNSIKKVIYQSGQFQPVSNGEINQPADKESIKAVQAVLSGLRNIAKDSLFFYNPNIATNRWLDSRETTVVIGQHVFKN
ncbi:MULTISPECIES: cell wall hydrolase [Metabacillus]|uniref:N-acetylmuramoyl-L-alanine amidase n=2 Tax=Metabacillus TaxID=2675233 RepID=A0A179SPG1_9BACI|nr:MULTISPECIES: cell wall hydrolase [Metabacillus]OAS82193.1 N-acetylmuramoyl-L-alanine amidase [Metabacillus litoralis]QNF29862.1 cell wall hydrolase [Metabacillus sp. KUDC1714]